MKVKDCPICIVVCATFSSRLEMLLISFLCAFQPHLYGGPRERVSALWYTPPTLVVPIPPFIHLSIHTSYLNHARSGASNAHTASVGSNKSHCTTESQVRVAVVVQMKMRARWGQYDEIVRGETVCFAFLISCSDIIILIFCACSSSHLVRDKPSLIPASHASPTPTLLFFFDHIRKTQNYLLTYQHLDVLLRQNQDSISSKSDCFRGN
jgi:hypothetical protein